MYKYLQPDWPIDDSVHAVSTTRAGGTSSGAYNSFNLGLHVGDDATSVQSNRNSLMDELGLPSVPVWLNQVHGTDMIYVEQGTNEVKTADAAWTDRADCVLSVMTADCLPVLLCAPDEGIIAVAHGGWRGLAGDILQKTVAALPVDSSKLVAWLGPAIGPGHFEVGVEVRDAFREEVTPAFRLVSESPVKYHADIFEIGRFCLQQAGVEKVFGGGFCTFKEQKRFFSHRRDLGTTGRMASLIWRTK